ncbi:hypothetical protein Niako_1729 [Niastella koreensis GR20-10]|uniref:Uncharacterized protein n=1 Tax=Niastella koreensis (strain DSM 17620 / KACC 11465 / NBRC 106392 / GR20-10) TaxID=700598 RepID=G8T9C4_NIAKG|nr:hypothetical protein Niako_1729 [Niastella koreensis GR20-10]
MVLQICTYFLVFHPPLSGYIGGGKTPGTRFSGYQGEEKGGAAGVGFPSLNYSLSRIVCRWRVNELYDLTKPVNYHELHFQRKTLRVFMR